MGHEARANDERKRMRDAMVDDEPKDWVVVIDGAHNWIGKLRVVGPDGEEQPSGPAGAAFRLEPVYELHYLQSVKDGRLLLFPHLLPVLGMGVGSLVLNPERTTIPLAELHPENRAKIWALVKNALGQVEHEARLNRMGLVGPGAKG